MAQDSVAALMNACGDHESGRLRCTVREAGSVAALVLIMALVFTAYFVTRVAMPELPLHVLQALASLPW